MTTFQVYCNFVTVYSLSKLQELLISQLHPSKKKIFQLCNCTPEHLTIQTEPFQSSLHSPEPMPWCIRWQRNWREKSRDRAEIPSACRHDSASRGSCMRSASARRMTHSVLLSLSLSLWSLVRFVVLPRGLQLDLGREQRKVFVHCCSRDFPGQVIHKAVAGPRWRQKVSE